MQAIKSGDLTKVVAAIRDGVVTVAKAGVDFVKDSVTDIAQAIRGALPGAAAAKPAATKVKSAAATDETSNGATDLTDGNKAEPGKVSAAASRRAGSSQAASDRGRPERDHRKGRRGSQEGHRLEPAGQRE